MDSTRSHARRFVPVPYYGEKQHPIEYFRLKKGWSQKQLAHCVGTSQPYIARLEAGGVDPQLSTLRRLAAALDIPIATVIEALPERGPQ